MQTLRVAIHVMYLSSIHICSWVPNNPYHQSIIKSEISVFPAPHNYDNAILVSSIYYFLNLVVCVWQYTWYDSLEKDVRVMTVKYIARSYETRSHESMLQIVCKHPPFCTTGKLFGISDERRNLFLSLCLEATEDGGTNHKWSRKAQTNIWSNLNKLSRELTFEAV
jgi:hypothetical protein